MNERPTGRAQEWLAYAVAYVPLTTALGFVAQRVAPGRWDALWMVSAGLVAAGPAIAIRRWRSSRSGRA